MTEHTTLKDDYVLGRSKQESKRLNDQHYILTSFMGGKPIHPGIPLENITTIADVATGTGIWMTSASAQLASEQQQQNPPDKSTTPTRRRHFHGFDISADQFPQKPVSDPESLPAAAADDEDEVHFHIQDVRKPFPSAFHNMFDLVHIRAITSGILEADFKIALTNVLDILKPGAYIQWGEIAINKTVQNSAAVHPRLGQIIGTAFDAGPDLKLSRVSPDVIYQNALESGMQNVQKFEYSTRSTPTPVSDEEVQRWSLALLVMQLPLALVLSGKKTDQGVVKKKAGVLMEELEDLYSKGVNGDWVNGVVTAQKPLD